MQKGIEYRNRSNMVKFSEPELLQKEKVLECSQSNQDWNILYIHCDFQPTWHRVCHVILIPPKELYQGLQTLRWAETFSEIIRIYAWTDTVNVLFLFVYINISHCLHKYTDIRKCLYLSFSNAEKSALLWCQILMTIRRKMMLWLR